jgi:hypothetical protein
MRGETNIKFNSHGSFKNLAYYNRRIIYNKV